MYAFFDPNDAVVPYRIVGATYPVGMTEYPGSCGGLPSVYVDDQQYPDVVANIAPYKIDSVSMTPIPMTQAELNAIAASYVPPAPTADEKIAALQKENSTLKTSVNSSNSTLTGLIDYVMTLPTV